MRPQHARRDSRVVASISRASKVTAMLIRSHIGARASREPLAHGGDLAAARQMFPDAPEPFIDLSTGINPHPYPLPGASGRRFCAPAGPRAASGGSPRSPRNAYGAPSPDHVVPAPGTQILLPQVAALVPPGPRRDPAPDLCGACARGGAGRTRRRPKFRASISLRDADLAVVVNPNNPDGRIVAESRAAAISRTSCGRAAAFSSSTKRSPTSRRRASASPATPVATTSWCCARSENSSGLPDCGSASRSPPRPRRSGSTPCSGRGPSPARRSAIGEKALADSAWKAQTLARSRRLPKRLDELLVGAGLEIVGGTSLYPADAIAGRRCDCSTSSAAPAFWSGASARIRRGCDGDFLAAKTRGSG